MSAGIEKIRLIDGLGQIHQLDEAHEPELFSAARVNLGCLGVVTEITFGCVEAFDLEECLELVDFDTAQPLKGSLHKSDRSIPVTMPDGELLSGMYSAVSNTSPVYSTGVGISTGLRHGGVIFETRTAFQLTL